MENFLLMFNSNTKYSLTRYWQKLEEAGFDMVLEYNKVFLSQYFLFRPLRPSKVIIGLIRMICLA